MKHKILYSTFALLLMSQSVFAQNNNTVSTETPSINIELLEKISSNSESNQNFPIVDDPAYLPTALTQYPAVRVRATGYASPQVYTNVSAEQKRIMTIRASKSEALRSLAEKIYGVKVNGLTTVSNMTLMRDSYDLTVDGLVRGASIVKGDFLPDGTYKTVVEIKLNRNLYERLMSQPYLSQYNNERFGQKVEKINIDIKTLPVVPSNYYYESK